MPITVEEKADLLSDLVSDKTILEINKIKCDARYTKNKKAKMNELLIQDIAFDYLINDLNKRIENDAMEIIKLLNMYKKNPIQSKTKIDLNAYDYVVPFSDDPVNGKQANIDLQDCKGNYVFVMTQDYSRQKDFNNVYSGAPLNDLSINIFKKNDILYVGTAKSILTRMHAHFQKDDKYNHTGSLKLGSDARKSILGNIVVYAFCIKKTYAKYYSIIAPKVEKYLHEKLNVLVGNK